MPVKSSQSPVFRVQFVDDSMKGYKGLKVWQRSKALAKVIYVKTEGFPKGELYGLVNQMRRCAVSVPSNIAEGHARKEFKRFLDIAYGSLNELETQAEIAMDLGFLKSKDFKEISSEIEEIGKMINGLKRSIESAIQHSLRTND